jgi:hypothetical protein
MMDEKYRNKSKLSIDAYLYHNWRINSEFFEKIEYPLLFNILSEIDYHKVVELGSGTGLWISICKNIKPDAWCCGIELNKDFVDFAQSRHNNKIKFHAIDITDFENDDRYDLILSAMSADYIGFNNILNFIEKYVSFQGMGLIWFLDNNRYRREGEYKIKEIIIESEKKEILIDPSSISDILDSISSRNLTAENIQHSFTLTDQIQRILHVLTVKKSEYKKSW